MLDEAIKIIAFFGSAIHVGGKGGIFFHVFDVWLWTTMRALHAQLFSLQNCHHLGVARLNTADLSGTMGGFVGGGELDKDDVRNSKDG